LPDERELILVREARPDPEPVVEVLVLAERRRVRAGDGRLEREIAPRPIAELIFPPEADRDRLRIPGLELVPARIEDEPVRELDGLLALRARVRGGDEGGGDEQDDG